METVKSNVQKVESVQAAEAAKAGQKPNNLDRKRLQMLETLKQFPFAFDKVKSKS